MIARDAHRPPRIETDGPLDHARLPALLGEAIAAGGPAFLPAQRWFGDKDRRIDRVGAGDIAVVAVGPDVYALVVAAVQFIDGTTATYFLPLVVTLEPLPDEQTLAVLAVDGDAWRAVDALLLSRFRNWLLARIADGAPIESQSSVFVFGTGSELGTYLAAARTGTSRVVAGEQSNTSVIYGDAAILKVFRRLQPGLNPDVEIGRVLTERTGFRHVPPLLATAEYRIGGAANTPGDSIAMLQAFVPSRGDAWEATLSLLDRVVRDGLDRVDDPWEQDAATLGRRTGQLHVALAGFTDDPAFSPDEVTAEDTEEWVARTVGAAERQAGALAGLQGRLPAASAAAIERLQLDAATVGRRVAGYRGLVGTAKIRVHGDFHLGQVLRTLDGDVVLLDFEGEPARPVDQRRRKLPPLVDAAGLLRSFRYARAAALRAIPAEVIDQGAERLAEWERRVRMAFLDAYRAEVALSPVRLVPDDRAAFDAALFAWEFDKAVYELGYEMSNRPDWLDIPIATLVEETVVG